MYWPMALAPRAWSYSQPQLVVCAWLCSAARAQCAEPARPSAAAPPHTRRRGRGPQHGPRLAIDCQHSAWARTPEARLPNPRWARRRGGMTRARPSSRRRGGCAHACPRLVVSPRPVRATGSRSEAMGPFFGGRDGHERCLEVAYTAPSSEPHSIDYAFTIFTPPSPQKPRQMGHA